MISAKESINRLAWICHKKGVRDIVFSSGSRNAPVILSFTESGLFNCYSVPDERSAAFIALGLSLASGRPTAICCTSGSAAANYSPAICEAYYQGIPLVVLTADRPVEWIDQGIGQSIRQYDMYRNFIKAGFQFIQEATLAGDLETNDRMAVEALDLATSGMPGPVHINLPFAEPLYTLKEPLDPETMDLEEIPVVTPEMHWSEKDELVWKSCRKKLILLGQSTPDQNYLSVLKKLVEDQIVVLLTESTANAVMDNSVQTIDRTIAGFNGDNKDFIPDLVVTIGGPIISKKIKKLFLDHPPGEHWDVRPGSPKDTFKALTRHFCVSAETFFNHLDSLPASPNGSGFQRTWQEHDARSRSRHDAFLKDCPWSDLKVFDHILQQIPDAWNVHMANSTPVRYVQLCDPRKGLEYYSNRGVSGIDGCNSTALGFSLNTPGQQNLLFTGDLAFFYDSNAFFHIHRPSNLKIIVINNCGGGIFRIIDGPSGTPQLEKYFESRHGFTAKALAGMYNMTYKTCSSWEEFPGMLKAFLNSDGLSLLEIMTPPETNSEVLRAYFKFLSQ